MQDFIEQMACLKACGLSTEPRRTSRAVTNYANSLLKPLDLNLPQMSLMAAIAMNPEKTQAAMSEGLALDASTLTRNLIVLEGRGLVASEGGRGRGGKRVMLTEAGEDLLARGIGLWERFNNSILNEMSPEMLEAGMAFLVSLTEIADRLNAEVVNERAGSKSGSDD